MSEQNTAPEEEQNIPTEQEDAAVEAAAPTYEELQAQVEELQGQLKDEQLRGLANEQNLRRRHQQEIADTHKFAGQKFAAEMLPVKDPQPGDKLDPHQHQAMQAEESGQEANSIIRVLKKGYMLNDRILRPAMVVVAKSAENAE